MPKQKKMLLLLFCTFSLMALLWGCKEAPKQENAEETTEIKSFLLKEAQKEYADITSISINYSQILDFGVYYQFVGKADNGTLYEGMTIIDGEAVHVIDIAQTDTEVPITHFNMSGGILNQDDSESLFWAVSGVVHSPEVTKVRVFLSDDSLHEIRIGDIKAYNVVIANAQPRTKKIEAINKNGKVIYDYDWS